MRDISMTTTSRLQFRPRAKAPRVRTGCMTCKARHVKCDEEKPTCARCRRDGRRCDGYALPQQPRRRATHKTISRITPHQAITSDIPGSSTEKLYFHHVRDCTIKHLGRRSTLSKFWLDFVLPFAYHSDAVRHALITLGAAHRGFLNPHSTSPDPADMQRESFAILQYNRAIHHVKAAMAIRSPTNLQIILLCCLIFVCLENIRGNYVESIRHLKAGVRLLDPRQLSANMSLHPDSAVSRNHLSRICDIAYMFRCLGLDTGHFVGSNVVPLIDLAFYSLHTRKLGDETGVTRPFSSTDEAHNELRSLDIDQELRLLGCVEELWVRGDGDSDRARYWVHPSGDTARRALQRRYDGWKSRYKMYTTGRRHEAIATTQEMWDTGELNLQKNQWDAVLDGPVNLGREEAERMIAQVELLLACTPSSYPLFTFESNFVPPLAFICSFCKDVGVRWRAVKLLRSTKRREGVWDSQQVADVFEAGLMAEEQGVEVGPPNGPFLRLAEKLSDLGFLGSVPAITNVAQ